jgi:hypothetical protein
MIKAKHKRTVWSEVEILDDSHPGAGALGHKGKK